MRSAQDSGTQRAATVFFTTVAQRILERHPAPDLRGITVILPNYHVARPLAQALVQAARTPALLLPELVTLNDWVQGVPLDLPITPDSRRGALLYQQLAQRQWFDDADLWGMTRELLQLFDELTLSLCELPADAGAFAAAVEQAYEARRNEALQLEARLVFELWNVMQQGDVLDKARAYQRRLARLADQAARPLYVLRASAWDGVEQRFLDQYARRAPVEVFDLRALCEADTQLNAPQFFAATSLEQEARAAALQVRRWLAEGRRDIAVVAQDRVVARRMRALLERAQILVTDETGWTFATLAVSTAIDRWLSALQSDFYHHDLLDLLKLPFIFAEVEASARKAAVFRLERLLRERNVVSGIESFRELAAGEVTLTRMMERMAQAAVLFESRRKRPLAEWLAALRESLRVLGLQQGLQQDDAGRRLLQVFAGWQVELQGDIGRYGFDEWRGWLRQQFDSETYRDSGIASPVRFTHLAATRWRRFEAVLLLGCDAQHLPSVAEGGSFFNDAVRAALGLPTRAFHARRQRDDLHALLALNDKVLVTWQKERKGEQGLLSPYLQIIRDAQAPDAAEQMAEGLRALLALEDAHRAELPRAAAPAPSVAAQAVPARISISGYNALVACPYQFHARHILKLNELDEVQEAIEKRDYGDLVHQVLQRFHERYRCVSEHEAGEVEAALRELSHERFAALLERDFVARAWLTRWLKTVPDYLAWQRESEAAGWRYAAAEQAYTLELERVTLRGRIDRLDVRGDERRVLDYKTQRDGVLRARLKEPGEDVQLACYAQMADAVEAAFVSLDGEVKAVVPPHELAQLAPLNIARLESIMARVRSGTALPANGIEQACMHCEVRGVCRKGMW